MAYKLLLLEDDPDLRETLLDCLVDQGYEVVAVGRGQEAVEEAARQEFDLFISDIRMEGLNGLDAIEQAQGHQPELTSMVVSGYSSEAETLRAIQLQVGAYMQKPFSMRDFVQQVNQLLEQRQQQQRYTQQSHQLHRVLIWALETLVTVVDETALVGPVGFLQRVGQTADAMSATSRLPQSLSEQIRLSAQFAALANHPKIRLPSELGEGQEALVEMKALIGKIEDQSCRELPAQIGRFALRHSKGERAPEAGSPLTSGSEPSSSEPSSSEPEIEKLYQESLSRVPGATASEEVLRGLGDPQRMDRSLLALARMFERSGDTQHANQAYQEICSRSPHGPEAVQSHLGLARLAIGTGHTEKAEGFAIAAYQKALNLGPLTSARTCLEAGLLLARINAPLAPSALERACESLQQMGQSTLEAQARLALSMVRPGSVADPSSYVGLLLRPAHAAELADSLSWLAPILLEFSETSKELQAGMLRLLGQYGDEIARLLQASRFSIQTRQLLLKLLATAPESAPGIILKALKNDPEPKLREQANTLPSDGEVANSPLLRFQSLGFFHCFCGPRQIADADYRSQKTKYFLAYLALNFGKPLADEQLVEMFWPEAGARGLKNLNSAVFRIRQCLRPEEDGSGQELILRQKSTLEFNRASNFWHDFEEWERAVRQGERFRELGQVSQALQQYRRVCSLYVGPYLEGCYLEWALRRRSWIEEKMSACLRDMAQLAYGLGNHSEVQEATNFALEIDAADQESHILKMRSLLASGKPEVAIRHFEKTERHLRQEYELEPSTELLRVYHMCRYGIT